MGWEKSFTPFEINFYLMNERENKFCAFLMHAKCLSWRNKNTRKIHRTLLQHARIHDSQT